MSSEGEPGSRSFAILAISTLSTTMGALPVFLVGSLAVLIRRDLGFSEAGLGAVVSLYYVSSALTSVPAGRLAERLGARRAMATAAATTFGAVLGIAVLARSWITLAILLVVAGMANGLSFPASNLALTRGFPPHRQGVGFALKQSAGPYSTLLAGASVPAIGLTVGWRWAFVCAAVATIPVVVAGRRRGRTTPLRRPTVRPAFGRPLAVLALGGTCAVAATSSMGAFYVESAVADGIDSGVAGTVLALGSVSGVIARLGWGWLSDRHHSAHFPLLTFLLSMGAVGFAGLPAAGSSRPLLLATVLVFATGWSWPSLLSFAVVLRSPEAPAAASGIIGAGQYGGGIIGPFTFGLIVEAASYRAAWSAAAGAAAVAALLMYTGGRWFDAARSRAMVTAQ